MRRIKQKLFTGILVLAMTVTFVPMSAWAAESKFDPAFYAAAYPDVVMVLGANPQTMYNHYLAYGMKEGRLPFNGATPGQAVEGIAQTTEVVSETATVTNGFVPVPLNKLANYKSIKKKMTDGEFQKAYDVALQIVTPLAGLSREDQLAGIASALRARFDSGMTYSMSNNHYNDPYGYFIVGTASCAGCARATGLCLNILGIPYEHVNENQYSHQWCRVNVNGTYWICDAFGLYTGPEPAPYQHPLLY